MFSTTKPPAKFTDDPLQPEIPNVRDGYLAAVYYGQRRSGDLYDFVRVSATRVLLGLFDVAGDLEQTRPILVPLQQKFRTLGALILQTDGSNEAEAMLELWVELNRTVMQAAGGVHPCPAFIGCYNEELKTLTYVNAGHTPGLLRSGREVTQLQATALPLGLFSHSVPDSSLITLQPANTFLLLSKGVVEAKRHGQEYGLERATQYLNDIGFETAHETCVGILDRVRQFMGTAPTHNDVTALSFVRSL
jgi:phosphoserine phosphatase RsbU/P